MDLAAHELPFQGIIHCACQLFLTEGFWREELEDLFWEITHGVPNLLSRKEQVEVVVFPVLMFTSLWLLWIRFRIIQLLLICIVVVSLNPLLILENLDLAGHSLEELFDRHIPFGFAVHSPEGILQLPAQLFLNDLLVAYMCCIACANQVGRWDPPPFPLPT